MAFVRSDWLALTQESALDPQLPICDPHHHLWVHEGNPYVLEDIAADIGSGHNVVSTVFVECMSGYTTDGPLALRPVGETVFVDDIAMRSAGARIAAGIVSFADLTLGDAIVPVLEAHATASSRFRGIRHASSWHPSADIRNSHTHPPKNLLADATFRRGFSHLVSMGYSFDAWAYHPQIDEITALAQAFPNAPIVLDHIGGPLGIGPYAGQHAEVFPVWKASISALAKCENVHVKLGGLVMPVNGFGWHKRERPPSSEELAQTFEPYFLHCIEQFGPQRCMFESNFPVDKVACSYTVLWNAFKRLTQGFSADERSALFHDTATGFYRL
jgi:L-fuconolactonase